MEIRWTLCIAALLALGCSGEPQRNSLPASEVGGPRHATSRQTTTSVRITRAEYGEDWPYSVSDGTLECEPPGSNVVLKAGGNVYALNGRAMGNARQRGYLSARDTITLRDENGYFTVGSQHKIIQRGLALCE